VAAAIRCAIAITGMAGTTSALAEPPKVAPATTFIQAGRLLADPDNGRVETAKTIVVEDGRIVAVRDGYPEAPAGAQVIDLRDRFVLPGLIDSHVHILAEAGPENRLDLVAKSASDLAIDGAMFARRTLLAGFTTVVDLGDANEPLFALRDGIAAGKIDGPRILASGTPIGAHGGHTAISHYRTDVMRLLEDPTLCTGADECARKTRQQINAGADIIKIMATGGVFDGGATGIEQQLTDDEMRAIVVAAHQMGRQVTAHAHGSKGIAAAVRAGVDSIEHGTFLDAESIRLMKAQGVWLVPTLMAGEEALRQLNAPETYLSPEMKAKVVALAPRIRDLASRVHAAGIKVAFGTDSCITPHGRNAREFELMVAGGFTPLEAIRAATTHAAAHLRLADSGRIATGQRADLIAVAQDPLRDVGALGHVSFVMANGRSYTR
jgi:imidazolonepropionase-like amidohydrolase